MKNSQIFPFLFFALFSCIFAQNGQNCVASIPVLQTETKTTESCDHNTSPSSPLPNPISPPKQDKNLEMIIFIHGTVGSMLVMFNPFKAFKDDLAGRRADYLNQKIRTVDWYNKAQPISNNLGLHKVSIKKISQLKQEAMAPYQRIIFDYHTISSNNCQQNSNTKQKYYIFNWSGLLSHKERQICANVLYDALKKEMARLQPRFADIKTTLIGHSHGGNVGLLMEKSAKEDQFCFKIDLLCLLATPIQTEADQAFKSGFFKKILNFYSMNDKVQVLDIVSTKSRKSKRIIESVSPETKLAQYKLLMVRPAKKKLRGPTHKEFWLYNLFPKKDSEFSTIPLVSVFAPILQACAQQSDSNDNSHGFVVIKGEEQKVTFKCVAVGNKKQYFEKIIQLPTDFIKNNLKYAVEYKESILQNKTKWQKRAINMMTFANM